MRCLIAIPTYNRAHLITRAVQAALGQSYENIDVMVIDDGSSDATQDVLRGFFDDQRFTYVKLSQNVGTARAKNAAIKMGIFDAISFHDSDDIPERDKILLQARSLQRTDLVADPCLNWARIGRMAGDTVQVTLALTAHWLIASDGSKRRIGRALSIVDDYFPNLQLNAGPLGDWILINSGLFRKEAITAVGGFTHGIEEDRDMRNKFLRRGEIIWFIDEPLVTKIECEDSLTIAAGSDYRSGERETDRIAAWNVLDAAVGAIPYKIDLAGVEIAFCSRPSAISRDWNSA
jgi:glycosyltransferase involved in cell wall biosynthesis